MQSKEKRKINPRRRLLMHLILAIVVIAILLVLGLRALKPKGAQIVYIAPDENGYDAIWLADLNDPENPRQLTFHAEKYVREFQISEDNSILFYIISTRYFSSTHEYRAINLNTGENYNVPLCEANICQDFQLHTSGEWIAYQEFDDELVKVIVQNLEGRIDKSEWRTIFETSVDLAYTYQPLPRWVGHTNNLVLRTNGVSRVDEFIFYNVEEDRIIETLSLNVNAGTPYFSDDGSFYSNQIFVPVDYPAPQTIRSIQNPSIAIYEASNSNVIVHDWHPNNETVLFSEFLFSNDLSNPNPFSLNLYNLVTGEKETLSNELGSLYIASSFNYDGTLVLSSNDIYDSDFDEIVIHDLETREEITLPIVGSDPQWVNGGR